MNLFKRHDTYSFVITHLSANLNHYYGRKVATLKNIIFK